MIVICDMRENIHILAFVNLLLFPQVSIHQEVHFSSLATASFFLFVWQINDS